MSVGGKVHMVTEFSDNLLMFLLKCRNPKVFGDRREDTVHIDGQFSVAEIIRSAGSSAWQKRLRLTLLQRQLSR